VYSHHHAYHIEDYQCSRRVLLSSESVWGHASQRELADLVLLRWSGVLMRLYFQRGKITMDYPIMGEAGH